LDGDESEVEPDEDHKRGIIVSLDLSLPEDEQDEYKLNEELDHSEQSKALAQGLVHGEEELLLQHSSLRRVRNQFDLL